jgi:hypothetical protein
MSAVAALRIAANCIMLFLLFYVSYYLCIYSESTRKEARRPRRDDEEAFVVWEAWLDARTQCSTSSKARRCFARRRSGSARCCCVRCEEW